MPQGHGLVWSNFRTVIRVWNNTFIPPWVFHSIYALLVLLSLQFPIFKIVPLILVISQLICRAPKSFAILLTFYIALRYIPVHLHPARTPVDDTDYTSLFTSHPTPELSEKQLSEFQESHLLQLKSLFSAATAKKFHKILGANTENSRPVHAPLMEEYNHWIDVTIVQNALQHSGVGKIASQLLDAKRVRYVGDAYKIFTTPHRSFKEFGYLKGDSMQKLLQVRQNHIGLYCPTYNAGNAQLRFYDKNFIPQRCEFKKGVRFQECVSYLSQHQVNFGLQEGDCVVFQGDIMHTILNSVEMQETEALFFFFAKEPAKFSGRVTYHRGEGRWSWCHNLHELHSNDYLREPCTPRAYPVSPTYFQEASKKVLLDFPMAHYKIWWLPHFFHFGDSLEVVLGFAGYLSIFAFCFFTMHRELFKFCVRSKVSRKKKRS